MDRKTFYRISVYKFIIEILISICFLIFPWLDRGVHYKRNIYFCFLIVFRFQTTLSLQTRV